MGQRLVRREEIKCRVINDHFFKMEESLEEGSPGTSLGPLVFIIFINGLEKGAYSEVTIFSHDSELY